MSLLEWILESRNRGARGSLDAETPAPSNARAGLLLLRGLVGTSLIGGGVYLAFEATRPSAGLGVLAAYLLVAYFVRPRPTTTNIGWAGGLVDHPFRWSDDLNRGLLFLRVLLWPGRFAVSAMRDMLGLIGSRPRPLAPPKRGEQVVWERRDP